MPPAPPPCNVCLEGGVGGVLAAKRKCILWGRHHHITILELSPPSPCISWSGLPRNRLPSPPNTPTAHALLFFPLQDKQNEASYLRDHKEELAEELATTILQKVGAPWQPHGGSGPAWPGPGPSVSRSTAVGTTVVSGVVCLVSSHFCHCTPGLRQRRCIAL